MAVTIDNTRKCAGGTDMGKILKNLRPYWHIVVVIILLLGVQAYCDLALPQYTSDIIDVGIQNRGVEHILPERMTAEEYDMARLFMTKSEKAKFEQSYEKREDIYWCIADEDALDALDEELLTPIILTYRMANMSEADFRRTLTDAMEQNEQLQSVSDQLEAASLEEIGSMLQVELHIHEAEDDDGQMVTYVDMRPLMRQLIQNGLMSEDEITGSRAYMEDMLLTMGNGTLSAMGAAYAADCAKAAGVDIDKVQTSYLWSEGGRMFGMALLMLLASVLVGYLASKVGAKVGRDLRGGVFKKVVGFSNTQMDQFSTASLITRSTNDIQQIQMVTAVLLRMLLYAPIIGIGGVYKVIQTGANMGWIIVLAVLVILAFVLVLMGIAMPKFKIMQKLVDALNLVSREILTGLSVIRAFGREKKEEERFDDANRNLTRTQLFTNRVMTFMMPGMMLVMYGITVLIVWVAAHRIDDGTLQVGAMTAFITYTMQIVMSFLMLTMMSIMLPRAGVAASRIDEVLKTESSIVDAKDCAELTQPKGVVRFSHVSFRYPNANEDVLSDIDFVAEPGKTTAIIGSTGCGKSTLVNLIPRFYDVTSGEITIDGADIRKLSLKSLRNAIGFVPQKGVLFSGSIASNLKFGRAEASQEELEDAAEIAQAVEFIKDKAKGYDSEIAQGGSNVSGGQKQRLSIARAIVRKPKIYVFDDSFSALDMKTDAALRKALEQKVSDATVFIVAQRISTILHADQILVLEDGKIVGKGTHEELLQNCEEYRQIAVSQLSERELGIENGQEAMAK